jgi:Ala-tRNA(Pro) deacylase
MGAAGGFEMHMPRRLESHLKENHTVYSVIQHAPTYSAQVAAAIMHIPGKEVAKTAVLCAGEKVLLAMLPASYRINFEKLSAIVGEKVQLVEEQKCDQMFHDCEAGAIPPFGELYGVPVYMDEALADDPEIVVGSGTLSESLLISNADFVGLVKPMICSFADKTWTASRLGKAQEQTAGR